MRADVLTGTHSIPIASLQAVPARRMLQGATLGILAGGLLVGAMGADAGAQARLEAHYRVTLAGLPIGSGSWIIDVTEDRYVMAANGQASGMMRVFASGNGDAAIRGVIAGTRISPTDFKMSVRSGGKTDQVQMALTGGSVKTLSINPPQKPNDKRIPVTEAHKRGVMDPITAGIAPRAGANGLGPEACRRTIPVFDGRQRYDLALSFKRMEQVRAEKGYEGPAVVCAVAYRPLGGYEKEKFATKFLQETRDLEMWYAPISGTKFLAVYRVVIPTAFGAAVLQATRFQSVPKTNRSDNANIQLR
jgi:hypothetical protein